MRPEEFFDVAEVLAKGTKEAEYRSAISRSYYFVFHLFKSKCFLTLPANIRAFVFGDTSNLQHAKLIKGLLYTHDHEINAYAHSIKDFKRFREKADYEIINFVVNKQHADRGIGWAEGLEREFTEIGVERFLNKIKDYYEKVS